MGFNSSETREEEVRDKCNAMNDSRLAIAILLLVSEDLGGREEVRA